MRYDPLLSRSDLFHRELFSPTMLLPIESIPLGEATLLCREDGCDRGRISEESFKKIRAFRKRMAKWDEQYGHWVGRDELTKGDEAA